MIERSKDDTLSEAKWKTDFSRMSWGSDNLQLSLKAHESLESVRIGVAVTPVHPDTRLFRSRARGS